MNFSSNHQHFSFRRAHINQLIIMQKILGILLIVLFAAILIGCFIYMLVSASEGAVLMWILAILIFFIGGRR